MPKTPSTKAKEKPQTPSPHKGALRNAPQGTTFKLETPTRTSPRLAARGLTADKSSLEEAPACALRPRPRPLFISSASTISPPQPKFDGSRLDSIEKLWLRHHYPVYLNVRKNATQKIAFLKQIADEFLQAFPSHCSVTGGTCLNKLKIIEAAKRTVILVKLLTSDK
ncbi:hypothetical protein GYMLUDRAFT_245736 [Collybiopsis luxurians FD-317 M1]|uniref:Uncharacterized protein n=1 Tax=Collybiopsis luxurians FD-317 M1 TaxID=944289 RepID=A0A0D0BU28_9AGAR|nr:hypothetical protein GYMLUDRAFT_245736 [Collybiopsis luxurians FD-317 M1]